jgi:hypothetical protein
LSSRSPLNPAVWQRKTAHWSDCRIHHIHEMVLIDIRDRVGYAL